MSFCWPFRFICRSSILRESRLLQRLHDDIPRGLLSGAERSILSSVVVGHLPESICLKERAQILAPTTVRPVCAFLGEARLQLESCDILARNQKIRAL